MIYRIFILVAMFAFIACNDEKEKRDVRMTAQEKKDNEEKLIRTNKHLIKEYAERIKSFAKRRDWNLEITETGLYYEIWEEGEGPQAETGKTATLKYNVSLLDGTVCYTSDSLGPLVFKIGQGGVETGLEEGILLLKEGDKARMVLPPYMAWGILGDENKIPPLSIIIYQIEVLKIADGY